MSSTSGGRTEHKEPSGAAVGVILFAGAFMMLGGFLMAMQGIVALANDEFFVVGEEYVFKFDVTTWGWIHLIVGILLALAGLALFRGDVWARTIAVIVASLSIIANFLWLPYQPVWSSILIAFGVMVIWATTMHGRDFNAD